MKNNSLFLLMKQRAVHPILRRICYSGSGTMEWLQELAFTESSTLLQECCLLHLTILAVICRTSWLQCMSGHVSL